MGDSLVHDCLAIISIQEVCTVELLRNSILIKCLNGAYAHRMTQNYYDKKKVTYYCKFWVYSLDMTLSG